MSETLVTIKPGDKISYIDESEFPPNQLEGIVKDAGDGWLAVEFEFEDRAQIFMLTESEVTRV